MLEAVSESHALIEKVGIYTLQHETKAPRESYDLGLRWGRRSRASSLQAVACLAVMLACPLLITFLWIALEHYESSLSSTLADILIEGPVTFFSGHWPRFSARAALGYGAWVVFQATLYYYLPCQLNTGQLTPAGEYTIYSINFALENRVCKAVSRDCLVCPKSAILIYPEAITWKERNISEKQLMISGLQ